jgi:RNA polymerase sigma-70 factor (ECF subfamily)
MNIARAAAGDARAMRDLYDSHAIAVYNIVRRLVGDPAMADEASQDAWINVFRNLASFRGDSAFSLWIRRIAINAALQSRRAAMRTARREVELTEQQAIDAAQEQSAERRDLRERVEAALRRLPAGMRAVIVLHDIEGHTHQEIGSLLGVSAGTSKSQLFKARVQLRQLLSTVYGEHSNATSG